MNDFLINQITNILRCRIRKNCVKALRKCIDFYWMYIGYMNLLKVDIIICFFVYKNIFLKTNNRRTFSRNFILLLINYSKRLRENLLYLHVMNSPGEMSLRATMNIFWLLSNRYRPLGVSQWFTKLPPPYPTAAIGSFKPLITIFPIDITCLTSYRFRHSALVINVPSYCVIFWPRRKRCAAFKPKPRSPSSTISTPYPTSAAPHTSWLVSLVELYFRVKGGMNPRCCPQRFHSK